MKTLHTLQPRRVTALMVALALSFGPGGMLPLPIGQAWAATKAGKARESATVTLNFINAEIDGVARAMAAILNKQILVDPRVKGTVTLYSDQPMTPSAAYKQFLAALRGQGFSMVEVSGLLKIVPEAEAKLQTGTVDVGRVGRSGDQVLTQIFRVQYENVNNLVTVLRPLISPNNTINANTGTNTLVITDYADNLKRIGQMIAALDTPQSTDLESIPLQFGVAADMAPVVQKLLDAGGAAAGSPGAGGASATVVADSRTNSLLVRAPNAARLTMVRNVVSRLDRPGTAGVGGSGIHVVYLKNADAVKLATVLRASFPQGGAGGAASGGGSSPTTSAPNANAAMAGAGGASQQSTAPVSGSAQPSTGGFIQADPSTNSLVITASESLYKQLRAVIDQLDTRRAQIYVEAMIIQVTENKMAQAGFQWAAGAGSNNVVAAGTNLSTNSSTIPGLFSLVGAARSAAGALPGFSLGVLHKTASGEYNLGALASFLETNADGNLLSKPNMIALDNEEAKIVVGQNVPFVTGQYTNGASGGGTVNPFTTVERKDVGLTLRVRPQVGEGNTVRMTVFQENSSVSNSASSSGLITDKSSIETTIVVDDGQILVLGGLLSDDYSDGEAKVPLLGDIPILGNLFKNRARDRKKKNLMVFLRPVVMRTQDQANELTLDRYDYMRQQQTRSQPDASLVMRAVNGTPLVDELKLSRDLAPVERDVSGGNATRLVPVKPAPAPADSQR
ncbi:MAG: type secretion system secretin GspD [Pseudomonadota bacterium]|jgi:general secretion pathway protein D